MAAASQYVLTLDIGSSAVRACAAPVDRPWELSAGAERRQRVFRARGGGLEEWFNPTQLRAAILGVLGAARTAAAIGPSQISAISVSAQRGGLALLRADGAPVHIGPNRDARAVFEGAAIDERLGQEVYARTGHLPAMLSTPAKLRWWRTQRPAAAKRVAAVATLGAWAVAELTGALAETPAALGEAGLLDVNTLAPAVDLLRETGVSPDLLPPLVGEGEPTAGLSATAASATGLTAGTPVYLAGPPTPNWRHWARVAHNRARRASSRDGAPRSSASPRRRRSTALAGRGLDSTRPRAVGWRRRTQGTRAVRSTQSAASWADA